jgi:cupin fold WbuC family metalloprotein
MARFTRDANALTASYFAKDATSFVDTGDIDEIKRLAVAESGPARYSLHASPASSLHSMVILQPYGAYAQPRKHLTKAKLFQIVDGEMVVVTFEQDGAVRAAHHLAADKVLVGSALGMLVLGETLRPGDGGMAVLIVAVVAMVAATAALARSEAGSAAVVAG